MKLSSIFFLGLGVTAAMASGDSNLRANVSSRQLSNSNQPSGGVWMYYLMLNALHGPLDHGCCHDHPPPRCHAPHFGPGPDSESCSSGSGSSGGGSSCTGDDCESSGRNATTTEESSSTSWLSWFSGSSTSTSSSAASDGYGTDDASGKSDYNGDDGTQEQYLANEYNNGGSGNAQNVGGSNGSNVWPFLAAALAVGIVAAALVTLKKKRQQRTESNRTTLSGSVEKRMRMFRKERPASSPLYENDYENEPSL